MRGFLVVILTSLLVFALSPPAEAVDYIITVSVDETTEGDIGMIETFLGSATEGSKVSKSLRRVTMAAVGELTLLLRTRLDDFGCLILDDGTIICLTQGDTITVQSPPGIFGVTFGTTQLPNGRFKVRPTGVLSNSPFGFMQIPPTQAQGPK